jgi:nitrogen fixation protein NifB
MSVEDALVRVATEREKRPNLKIVAISGPGDPLFNEESFKVLHRVRTDMKDVEFCLSTNGVLLSEYISDLVKVGLRTLTVTVNAVTAETASQLYEWAMIDGVRLKGAQMGAEVVRLQQKGIEEASRNGIFVKVNTVLIPDLNDHELVEIAKVCASSGATLHNIVPIYPFAKLSHTRSPEVTELLEARRHCEKHMPQFSYCHQCRCDVVGIPGRDTVL